MNQERPPARPWYDLVTEEIAIRGWGIAELARRAGVGRPTIYGWRDNPGKPQAASVNAVADALGIDRRRAVRLAGIVSPGPGQEIDPELMDWIERKVAPEQREALMTAIRAALSGYPGNGEDGASGQSGSSGRRAG